MTWRARLPTLPGKAQAKARGYQRPMKRESHRLSLFDGARCAPYAFLGRPNHRLEACATVAPIYGIGGWGVGKGVRASVLTPFPTINLRRLGLQPGLPGL